MRKQTVTEKNVQKPINTVQSIQVYLKQPWARVAIIVLLGVVIFELGVNFGNGRLQLAFWRHGENSQLPSQLDYSTVNQVYQYIEKDYDGKLNTSQLLDGVKAGLAQATGDPYTEYFNGSQAKTFNEQLDGSFTGIGAELDTDSNNNLIVVAPISNSPAAKAGLQPKDIITSIDGTSTVNLPVDQAVNKIRGSKGTKVTLQILRNTQSFSVTITRDDITVPSVNSQILDGNIGYITINQFSDDTAGLATQAAQKFSTAHVKGVILDLRDNPGGLVNAAVSVSSLWLDPGKTILTEKHSNKVVQTYQATGGDVLHGIPTVVLVNDGSASASEITAGALHDNNAAHIIGTKSFGKGSVQEIDNLSGGAELKVTIAHWYRPDGKSINHTGITPDQTVGITSDQVKAGQDPQKDAAVNWLNQH